MSSLSSALPSTHIDHLVLAMPGKAKAKAKAGDGMDPGKVSKMVGMLKYAKDKSKDEVRAREAEVALQAYKSLETAEEAKQFLEEYEAMGSGKGKDALKFALKFTKEKKFDDVVKTGVTENYLTRTVRAHLGLRLYAFIYICIYIYIYIYIILKRYIIARMIHYPE